MAKRGFFFDLSDALENSANVHRTIIARIERHTKRNLVCYVGNPAHPGGAIQDHDPDLLENVLRSMNLERYDRKLDLLVGSPGGFPYAAGKMVKVCRVFSTEFRTVVPNRAMSAATLLCLGARELVMAETASLGPIDPQMLMGSPQGQRLVPARLIIDSFRQMVAAIQQAIIAKQPPEPFLDVLNRLDVIAVLESMKAIDSTKIMAKELLRDGLLHAEPGKVDDVVEKLMAEGEKELHGKHLYPDAIQSQVGLPVTVLEPNSDLDTLLRELVVRIETYTARKGVAKYLVTRDGGINVDVHVAAGGR
jgi:hypothetical protein